MTHGGTYRRYSLPRRRQPHQRDDRAHPERDLRALDEDPDLVAALINLANIRYAKDELAEAQALYERAIALDPDCFEAHFNLGNIHHDLGRYEDALASAQRACEHEDLGPYRMALAELIEAGVRCGDREAAARGVALMETQAVAEVRPIPKELSGLPAVRGARIALGALLAIVAIGLPAIVGIVAAILVLLAGVPSGGYHLGRRH